MGDRPDDNSRLTPLGWSRAAFGTVFLLRTTGLLRPFHPLFLAGDGALVGWPDGAWHAPVLALALPTVLVAGLCVVRTAAACALALGAFSRVSGIVAGLSGYLVLAQDAFGYYHHLHLLFLGSILFAVTDSGARFALRPSTALSPRSSLVLMEAFVASIYLWAGIAKLRTDWLDGRALAMFLERGDLSGSLALHLLATPLSRASVACAVAALELALGPALLWRRTRYPALVVAFCLHIAFEWVGRVDSIGWQMMALLICFMPPFAPFNSQPARAPLGER